MNARTKAVALAIAGGILAAGGAAAPAAVALSTPSAGTVAARPAANDGSADRTLWTDNGAGSIKIHWTWHHSASSNSYYGSFNGTFYDHKKDGKYVLLQAKWKGAGWTTIRSAGVSGTFGGDYHDLNGLNFRACLQGGHCGTPAW